MGEREIRGFEIGDVVKLKSDTEDVRMTVCGVTSSFVTCVWHDRDFQPVQFAFNAAVLRSQ